MSKRVKLAEYVERQRDAGLIEVEMGDGTVFEIDPPQIWSDEVMAACRVGTNAALAEALLGGRYAEFVEKGGSTNQLINMLSEEHGVSLGE